MKRKKRQHEVHNVKNIMFISFHINIFIIFSDMIVYFFSYIVFEIVMRTFYWYKKINRFIYITSHGL